MNNFAGGRPLIERQSCQMSSETFITREEGKSVCSSNLLPERDYVTFGSLLSQIRLSVVCNVGALYSADSNFRQYIFAILYFNHPLTSVQKFYGNCPRGNPPSGVLNARVVAKYTDLRNIGEFR